MSATPQPLAQIWTVKVAVNHRLSAATLQPGWICWCPLGPYLSLWSSSRFRPYALQVATDASSLYGQRLAPAQVRIDILAKRCALRVWTDRTGEKAVFIERDEL